MRRRLSIVLAAATVLLSGLPAAALSRTKGYSAECVAQTATIPVRREQAQGYLPPGFESSVGSASQNEVPYVYFHSVVCGDANDPKLTMSFAYLLAHPPKKYAVKEVGDRFILAATIGGANARDVERGLCQEDLFADGDVVHVVHGGSSNTGDGVFGTTVESDTLSATWDIATVQLANEASGGVRWFFVDGEGVDYFDTYDIGDAVGLGMGAIRFTEPFLDLPPAGTGPTGFLHSQLYLPYRDCSKAGN